MKSGVITTKGPRAYLDTLFKRGVTFTLDIYDHQNELIWGNVAYWSSDDTGILIDGRDAGVDGRIVVPWWAVKYAAVTIHEDEEEDDDGE